MYTANEILSKVNQYINNLTYDRKPQSLYEPIKYVLSLGGKRIRPTLMLLSYNLFKDDPETILSPACALETYHNYTLLHDDLMDDAPLRRGQQTVHVRWDANTAILSGDSMLVLAFERMAQCDSRHLSEVLRLFTVTALEIGEGQQYDMEFENRNDVKEEEYIEMIRLKTSVLLACAMKIGAILADAPAEDVENLYKFGEQIGLAFQLQDDLLNLVGNAEVQGKDFRSDITEGKRTLAVVYALEHLGSADKAKLVSILSAHTGDTLKLQRAVELMESANAIKFVRTHALALVDEAKHVLENVILTEDARDTLLSMADFFVNRER